MNQKIIFSRYLKNLTAIARQGDAREESFYPALADMLKEMAQVTERPHVHVTTLPRPTEGGNPDFRLWNGTDRIIGYIEAKNPTEERLDSIENTDQLKRYRETFPNLILTNFLEFRLYRNGERVETVRSGRPIVLNKLGTTPPLENQNDLYALLDRFLDFALPQTFTAESLAVELAKRTRLLRDVIGEQLRDEQDSRIRFLRSISNLPHRIADTRRLRRPIRADHHLRPVRRPHPIWRWLQSAHRIR